MTAARRPQSFWQKLCAEAVVDGVAAVARRHQVNRHTLAWWRWKRGTKKTATAPRLLPVHVADVDRERSDAQVVEIAVDAVRARVVVGTDAQYVAWLVSTLRARCSR
jgi:hypothetical protein